MKRFLVGRHVRLAVTFGVMLLAVPLSAAPLLENHDPFCAACHTQPEVEYFERSLAPATDLAAAHAAAGTRCINCHSGPGLAGRVESLALGASDLAAYLSGDYAQPAATTHPIGDEGCTKCHAQPRVGSDAEAPAAAISSSHYHFLEYTAVWSERQPDLGGTCAACHPAHAMAGSPSQGYRPALRVNAACEGCHQALSGWLPPSTDR